MILNHIKNKVGSVHLILTPLTCYPDSPGSLHLSRSSIHPHLLLCSLSRHQSPPDSPPAGHFSSSVDVRLVCSDRGRKDRKAMRGADEKCLLMNSYSNTESRPTLKTISFQNFYLLEYSLLRKPSLSQRSLPTG